MTTVHTARPSTTADTPLFDHASELPMLTGRERPGANASRPDGDSPTDGHAAYAYRQSERDASSLPLPPLLLP